MLADATTSTPVFWIFGSGDLVAIGAVIVAIASNVLTVIVTNRVQDREDRRAAAERTARDESDKREERWRRAADKRDRVNSHFVRIIVAANTLASMVGPAQWTPDHFKSDADRKAFADLLDAVMRPMPEAAANLTIEEITVPIDTINGMLLKFYDFRRRLAVLNTPEHDKDDWDLMFQDKTAIEEARNQLEKDIPGILKGLQSDP